MNGRFWSEQGKRESGFKAMNLKPELLRGILASGFRKPWPVQAKAINLCLKGRNVFAQAQPGCGKSIALCISVLQRYTGERRGTQIIVVAATNELAQKITDTLYELMEVVVNDDEIKQNKPEESKFTSRSHRWFESTKLGSSSDAESCDFDWSGFKRSTKCKTAETLQSPSIIVNTHEGVMEMVRSKKIVASDLSTVKLFAMDEPSGMVAKRSRQVIEFAEIKSFLPKCVQLLVFHSSLSDEVLKACSKFVPSAEFIDCGKDMRVIQGIDQLYVGIKEEVSPQGQVVEGVKEASAMIERIFKCKSYYDIFGVTRTANANKINGKYKALSKRFHPDKCSETHSTEVFKLINHAKNVLLDVKKRSDYDCGADFLRPIQFKPIPDNMIYRFNSALKLGSLCRLLKSLDEDKRSMIFCDDPDGVSAVSQEIIKEGHTTVVVHSKMSRLAQDLELLKFCDGSARFLVTTTLSGRAMTAPCVQLVINYDLPANCEDYGRSLVHFGPLEQREGAVINFITKEAEREMIEKFEVYYEMKIKERNVDNVFKTCRE